jgi:phosphate transport system permease protein
MTAIQHISTSRRIKDRVVQGLVYLAFALAVVPLVSVLWLVIKNGLGRFDLDFLTHSMRNIGARDAGGGAYHAIIGTLEQVLLASIISVPIGLLTAIYLVEYGNGGRLSRYISFFVDVMTGVPSVVAGLFILAFWVLFLGQPFSGFAGALALSILMMPTVVRSAEEMLRLVPNDLREASYALGVAKWRTIMKVVLPTSIGGIITGIMLATARVIGETAPLLVIAGKTDSVNFNLFGERMTTLPVYIYYSFTQPGTVPFDAPPGTEAPGIARAWGAALVLIVIVMALNLIARLIGRIFAVKKG